MPADNFSIIIYLIKTKFWKDACLAKEEKLFLALHSMNNLCSIYLQCPPCRGFTPKLVETYKNICAEHKPFEIIFVSSDRGEEGFNEYFKDMPWLAVPFGDESGKKLSARFSVQGKKI